MVRDLVLAYECFVNGALMAPSLPLVTAPYHSIPHGCRRTLHPGADAPLPLEIPRPITAALLSKQSNRSDGDKGASRDELLIGLRLIVESCRARSTLEGVLLVQCRSTWYPACYDQDSDGDLDVTRRNSLY